MVNLAHLASNLTDGFMPLLSKPRARKSNIVQCDGSAHRANLLAARLTKKTGNFKTRTP
jgi:hypothetical protein